MVLQLENCVSMVAQQDFLANKDSPTASMLAQQDVLANKDSPPAIMVAHQDVLANRDSPPASMVAHQDVLANSEYILSTTTKKFTYVGGGPCTTLDFLGVLLLLLPFVILSHCSDHLEVYLRYCCMTVEFAKFMDDLDIRCQAEFNGSILYKHVQILVCFLTFSYLFNLFITALCWRPL